MKRFICICLVFLVFSCSSSKQIEKKDQPKKKAELDALFGISDSSASGDDELLTLLENKNKKSKTKNIVLGQEEKKEEPAPVKKDETAPSKQIATTPDQSAKIKNLETELRKKSDEISALKSENARLRQENETLKNRKPEVQVVYKEKPANTSTPMVSDNFEQSYLEARSYFDARQYEVALKMFEQLTAQDPNHKLADNAQYWVGECHYALKRYDEAILDFEKVFTYKQSNKNADAEFKLGLSHLKLKDYDNSKLALQRFIDKYPSNRNAERAQKLLSTM